MKGYVVDPGLTMAYRPPFVCPHCGKGYFITIEALRQHLWWYHRKEA